jgi:two-component system sensor histidine kinase EvgS
MLEGEQKKSIHFLPATVLVVDDVKDNRQLLIANFKESKLQVVSAQNGLEAVTLAKQQHFDLIIMDIRMPVMDGYEAAEKIKQFSKVPIIALTASVLVDEFEKLKADLFDGYLRKPVLKEHLIEVLSSFLAFETSSPLSSSDESTDSFSDAEYKVLPFALDKLEQLLEKNKQIAEHNDLSEISHFAESIIKITDRYPLTAIQEYAQQLIDQVAIFDIAAIKRTLNSYPSLLATLKSKKG